MLEETELFYLESPELLQMLRNTAAIAASLSSGGSVGSNSQAKKNGAVTQTASLSQVQQKPSMALATGSRKAGEQIKKKTAAYGPELIQELRNRYQDLMSGDLLTILYVRQQKGSHEISAYIDLEDRFRLAETARNNFKQESSSLASSSDDTIMTTKNNADVKEHVNEDDELIKKWLDVSPQPNTDLSHYDHNTNAVKSNNSRNFTRQIQNNYLIFKAVKTSKLYSLLNSSDKISVSDQRFKQIVFYDFYQNRK